MIIHNEKMKYPYRGGYNPSITRTPTTQKGPIINNGTVNTVSQL